MNISYFGVFLWFSSGFPMVSLWFSSGFPMVFLWFGVPPFTIPKITANPPASLPSVHCPSAAAPSPSPPSLWRAPRRSAGAPARRARSAPGRADPWRGEGQAMRILGFMWCKPSKTVILYGLNMFKPPKMGDSTSFNQTNNGNGG